MTVHFPGYIPWCILPTFSNDQIAHPKSVRCFVLCARD
jgi:hypothetical protein